MVINRSGFTRWESNASNEYKPIEQPKCPNCNGQKGKFDDRKVWRRCQTCKGTGRKKCL